MGLNDEPTVFDPNAHQAIRQQAVLRSTISSPAERLKEASQASYQTVEFE